MSLVVNTNLTSIVTQNYLSTSQSQLAQATQRLASGLRINSAADDAAGYSISQRMTAQVNGDNTAIQNTNNAVSLAQTAQGSLSEITNNLQRVRELAVEAANATNSASDRQSLNNEASQLLQEVDRVASSASFNGVKLLDGTFTSQQFQVGANAGDTISIASISSARIGGLGQGYSAQTSGAVVAGSSVTGAGQMLINGKDIYTANGSNTIAADAQSLANAINNAGITGVTASAAANSVTGANVAANNSGKTFQFTINNVTTSVVTESGTAATDQANYVAAINSISAATGVTASASGGALKLSAVDGRNISVAFVAGTATAAQAATDSGLTAQTSYSTLTVSSSNSTALTTSGNSATVTSLAASTTAGLSGTSLANIDISSATGATTALTSLDNALNTINATNASLGAYQNRFQSAVASLQAQSQNLTAARSTIQDTDFAASTAAETRANVLQQAGVAVLGQANSQPQQILSLLQHL